MGPSMVATTRSLGSMRQFSLQYFVLNRRMACFAVRAAGHQLCTRPTSDLSRVRAYSMSQQVVWPGAENPRLSALKQLQCRSVLGHLAKAPALSQSMADVPKMLVVERENP